MCSTLQNKRLSTFERMMTYQPDNRPTEGLICLSNKLKKTTNVSNLKCHLKLSLYISLYSCAHSAIDSQIFHPSSSWSICLVLPCIDPSVLSSAHFYLSSMFRVFQLVCVYLHALSRRLKWNLSRSALRNLSNEAEIVQNLKCDQNVLMWIYLVFPKRKKLTLSFFKKLILHCK